MDHCPRFYSDKYNTTTQINPSRNILANILSDLNRQRLTSIDTAPKWPNPPRFRFKRRFVSTLVQEYFGKKFDKLPDTYTSFEEIDAKCHELTQKYSGKTISELFDIFNIKMGKAPSKEDAERVVVKMFGGTASKINKVEMLTTNIPLSGKQSSSRKRDTEQKI